MKRFMIFTVGVCLLFAAVPAVAQSAADEAAILKAEENFDAAWNAHDAKVVVATMVENVEGWEGQYKGKAAIEEQLTGFFAGPGKDFHTELLDVIGVYFVTPDVAIYKARYEASGVVDEGGNAEPAEKLLFARVYVKKNGGWLGAAMFTRPIEE
jgi:uncharacterized protein (TIGR02246 family)